jgi:hypothetical protein
MVADFAPSASALAIYYGCEIATGMASFFPRDILHRYLKP